MNGEVHHGKDGRRVALTSLQGLKSTPWTNTASSHKTISTTAGLFGLSHIHSSLHVGLYWKPTHTDQYRLSSPTGTQANVSRCSRNVTTPHHGAADVNRCPGQGREQKRHIVTGVGGITKNSTTIAECNSVLSIS